MDSVLRERERERERERKGNVNFFISVITISCHMWNIKLLVVIINCTIANAHTFLSCI
jgi:hypothetical protein